MGTRLRENARRSPRLSPLERLGRGLERILGTSSEPAPPRRRVWLPRLKLVDSPEEIVLRLDSPEIDPRKIRIQLSGRVLTLSAAVSSPAYRAFRRRIVLPVRADPRQIQADCDDRTLTVRIRKALRPPAPGSARKVREIMTRNVRFVTPGTSIREAAELLRELDIGSVPVCLDGDVVGILTDRDIAVRVTAKGLDPVATRVGDVMTRDVVMCWEDDDLVDVEQLLHDRQIRRIPVLGRSGSLVGYLTMARIARSESDLRSGHVLRGISQPGEAR